MNEYEARQEAKRERLERAADRAQGEATARYAAAARQIDGIPSGQPILIGHHSEKRHRNALAKHDRHMRKSIALEKEAKELARRADAVGTGGISSDDPDAVTKLTGKLADLERQRDRMKQANALYRKQDRDGLSALGFDLDRLTAQVAAAYSWEKQPFPKWQIANLGARIRDARARAADLARVPDLPALVSSEPETIGTATITVATDELRVSIRFAARLSKPDYQTVRRYGFVWSPTRNAFVRKYSPATLAEVLEYARCAARVTATTT